MRVPARLALLRVVLIGICLLGCSESAEQSGGSEPTSGAVSSVFVVPGALSELSGAAFFDQPWPSDLRRDARGSVVFTGFPNPREQPILDVYVESMTGVLDGFSPVATGYLRFTGLLDRSSLPATPPDALEPESSLVLLDIDPSSPELGRQKLVTWAFRGAAGVYAPSNTLAFMPALGYPLRRHTRYALVVTDAVRAAGGGHVERAPDLDALLSSDPASAPLEAAQSELASAVTEIERAGIAKSSIVHLAVFTTNDPVAPTEALRDAVRTSFPAPSVDPASLSLDSSSTIIDVFEGTYGPSPDFQRGTLPFQQYGTGGELSFDADGVPVVERRFDLRFALAVPKAAACPEPANGYPIVLYAHGTGGNYRTMLGDGDEAESLGQRCIATMGIDQIFHGTRPGGASSSPELLFFNVVNPVAGRANAAQSAIDVVQQARLFSEMHFTLPTNISGRAAPIAFDAEKLAFVGHSQGGINGPLFLAVDDQALGGVLSGSASMLSIALLEKKEPIDVPSLIRTTFLGLTDDEADELDLFHPAISLAQTIVDPADPIHYVASITRTPRSGFAPKSLFMTEGVNPDGRGDSYAPPHGIEVQAVAAGLPPEEPLIHPIPELAWGALVPVDVPAAGIAGNLAAGQASGTLAQWRASDASDGHFVLYDIPAAMQQATLFVRHLIDEPNGRVPAR
jgi:predicted esterase